MTQKKRKRAIRRPGRGSLVLISGFLIGSAVIRIGGETGQALAKAEQPAVAPAMMPSATCEPAPDLKALMDALSDREDRLGKHESEIRNRRQALAVADREIEKRLLALTEAEAALRATIALAETAAEDDLARLTSVYENMKPKDAAALFEEMAPEFAAGFLGRMRPDAAAGVMAGLSPKAAYTVSVVLAGRNADVPDE